MQPQVRERRLVFLAVLAVLTLGVLVGRMGYLEFVQGTSLRSLGVALRVRVMPILAPRGLILSSDGKRLATNMPSFSAEFFDLGEPLPQKELSHLASILKLTPKAIQTVVQNYRGQPYIPVTIKTDLTPQQITQLDEQRPNLPGVFVQAQPLRTYPLGDVAAHVVGYVQGVTAQELKSWHDPRLNQNSIVGQSGLEYQYQKYLQGTDGGEEVEVDSFNKPVKVLGTKAPVPGDNLHTTISAALQKEANRALIDDIQWQQTVLKQPASSGAVIVMDVHTGAVLAMASYPSFNPNWFAQGMTTAEAKQVFDPTTDSLLNRAIDAIQPPGSTFKMATAVAALATGAITPSTLIQGLPRYWYPPYPWNWVKAYTGWNDLSQAIGQSNDIFFYETGRLTGIDAIAHWASILGFGKPTGIDLPGEASGLMPTKALYTKQNGAWYPGLVYDVAIGQGEDLATLLQLCDYVGALAEDGVRYEPYLVQAITTPKGQTVYSHHPVVTSRVHLSAADWQAIHDGMNWATRPGAIPGNGGTAGPFFQGFPLQVAGKTGTAQVSGQPMMTWFVTYGPYKNPQIAIAVQVAGGVEGAYAAPVARDIYDYYYHLKDPGNILAPNGSATKSVPAGVVQGND
jgi:penicillin-binding protein 2